MAARLKITGQPPTEQDVLHTAFEAFEQYGTEDAIHVARIVAAVRTLYFFAENAQSPEGRRRYSKALAQTERAIEKLVKARPIWRRAERPSEALRRTRDLVRSILQQPRDHATNRSPGNLSMVLMMMIRSAFGELPYAGDPEALDQRIRRAMKRAAGEQMKLKPSDAERIVERALVAAGMDKKEAHRRTNLLRQ